MKIQLIEVEAEDLVPVELPEMKVPETFVVLYPIPTAGRASYMIFEVTPNKTAEQAKAAALATAASKLGAVVIHYKGTV